MGSPPYIPGGPPSQPPAPRVDDDDDERDPFAFGQLAPTGSTYENPVASGSQFLFGGSLSGGQSQGQSDQQEPRDGMGGLFGGVASDSGAFGGGGVFGGSGGSSTDSEQRDPFGMSHWQ